MLSALLDIDLLLDYLPMVLVASEKGFGKGLDNSWETC